MDFLLSGAFARFDAWFLIANLTFLIAATVSYVVEKLFWLFRVVSPIKPNCQAQNQPAVQSDSKAETAGLQETAKAAPSKTSTPEAAVAAPTAETPETSETEAAEEVAESSSGGPSTEDRQQAGEIAKLAKTKIARGEFTEAKGKIIEGLAFDKFDKELNCLLASLYERDKDFKKAELVYKDLIVVHDTDPEIYMKLGFALSMQAKYEIAFEIYRKLHALTDGADEAIEMLANLAYQLERFEEARNSAKEYLRNHPRNVEMLNLLAFSQANLGERREALETLDKLRVIDPYNAKIREFAEKIALELELEGNFGNNEPAA
ncbi:MAG: tetratricopeptide repeat protein [Patescibacteria group bacterium]